MWFNFIVAAFHSFEHISSSILEEDMSDLVFRIIKVTSISYTFNSSDGAFNTYCFLCTLENWSFC